MSVPRKYVRRSREQWVEPIQLQPNSGMNVSQFCQHNDVSYQSFINWRNRIGAEQSTQNTATEFIELTTPGKPNAPVATQQEGSGWLIELDLGYGLQLRIA